MFTIPLLTTQFRFRIGGAGRPRPTPCSDPSQVGRRHPCRAISSRLGTCRILIVPVVSALLISLVSCRTTAPTAESAAGKELAAAEAQQQKAQRGREGERHRQRRPNREDVGHGERTEEL
jgi:hypothetical protein